MHSAGDVSFKLTALTPSMPDQLLLLIHGVNSTGAWHNTMVRESRGLFECVPVKYRYYHGLTGPIKVYAWPAAVLFAAAFFVLVRLGWSSPAKWTLFGLLTVDVLLVIETEAAWSSQDRSTLRNYLLAFFRCWQFLWPPIVFLALALVTVVLDFAPVPSILAAIVTTSLYLDIREYRHPNGRPMSAALMAACAGVVALFAINAAGPTFNSTNTTWVFLAVAAVIFIEPFFRRRLAFRFVKSSIDAARRKNTRPHVIAHSLGTYMSGHLLNECDRLWLGRLIFSGCVLDRRFPWEMIVGNDTREGCWSVKNYVGGIDIVPVLTGSLRSIWVAITSPARIPVVVGLTRWLGRLLRWRPLGWAGVLGFSEQGMTVHTQRADAVCAQCIRTGQCAPVHNITSPFGEHSTLNQDPEYHFFQWLPSLWGQSADEFDYWKELCRIGNEALSIIDQHSLDDQSTEIVQARQDLVAAESALLGHLWFWPANPDFPNRTRECRGRQLDAYIRDKLRIMNVPTGMTLDMFLQRLPAIMFRRFTDALTEKASDTPRREVIECLQPDKLLIAALCDAINRELVDRRN